MAKKKIRDRGEAPDEEIEMNMTPMIDIVFQMILFFIIITDYTQKDIALLTLPWSTAGQDDEGDDPTRIIINITAPSPTPGELATAKGKKFWSKERLRTADRILVNGKNKTFKELSNYLLQNGVKNVKYRDKEKPHLSSRSLLIRCDGLQAFDYVKGVLQVCSLPQVAIYKVEIATAEEPGGDE
ncbi:MAG: biopolymer transporter ExbD [Planctomycetota bacterium]